MENPVKVVHLDYPGQSAGKMNLSSGKDHLLSHTVSGLCSELGKTLSKEEFQLLELKSKNTPYRTIAADFNSTAYLVRRRLDALLTKISRQRSADLFEIAWALDLILDEDNGESDFRSLGRRLGMSTTQIKFLTLLTRDFVKYPVQHHKNRIFRVKTELSRSP